MASVQVQSAPDVPTITVVDGTAQVQLVPRGQTLTVIQSASPTPGSGSSGSSGGIQWSPPSAQTTWTIPHNLGRKPAVTILDSNGDVIITDVHHYDNNTLSVTFAYPMTGTALLN